MKILVIHGPNLQLLGTRKPSVYGKVSLEAIDKSLLEQAKEAQVELTLFQSNHEGEIVVTVGKARDDFDGI